MKPLYLTILAIVLSFSAFAIGPITGPTTVCSGSSIMLSCVGATSGTWSIAGTAASINSASGLLTAGSAATSTPAVVSFTDGSTVVSATITVLPLPATSTYSVTGGGSYCSGGGGVPIDLSNSIWGVDYQLYNGSTPAGGVVAGTGSGITFGPQTAAGSYSVRATDPGSGCINRVPGAANVSINNLPADIAVSGGGAYCPGSPGVGINVGLTMSYTGIIYQLYGPGMVAIGSPIAGTGAAMAFAPVITAGTYSVMAVNATTACYRWLSTTATVTTGPTISTIAGPSSICAGSVAAFSNATPGGTWSTNNFAVATVVMIGGLVTAVSTGSVTLTYSQGGCQETKTLTVHSLPNTYNVTGTGTYCTGGAGASINLSGSDVGINYQTYLGATAVLAAVPGTGGPLSFGPITTGSGALAILSIDPVTMCVSLNGTLTVTSVAAPTITGTTSLCDGSIAQLSTDVPGGTWVSSNFTVAGVGVATGLVAAVAPGTTVIQYDNGGCSDTHTITVLPTPSISGASSVCDGMTTTLSSTIPGGSWSCSNASVATVTTAGIVAGVAPGVVNISYTPGSGCSAIMSFTVHPFAPITGATTVCAGSTTTLNNTIAGGTWASSGSAIASVNPLSPVVYGISGGTAVISYALPTGCASMLSFTVQPAPTISGPSVMCTGDIVAFSSSLAGGTWSVFDATTATIDPATGSFTGISIANNIVTYTAASGCFSTQFVTVNMTPSAIAGVSPMCLGNTLSLSNAFAGGTWSSSNPGIAAITSATGIVNSAAAGAAIVSYALPGGCFTTATVTVGALPSVSVSISPTSTFCAGNTATFTAIVTAATPTSYQWYINGSAVPGATSSAFTPTGLNTSDSVSTQATMTASCDGAVVTLAGHTPITVYPLPAVSASSAAAGCGGTYNLAAAGTGTSYSWSPVAGLSCSTCASPVANITATTTYTVTTTDANGCIASDGIVLNGNRITGHISYTGGVATDSFLVWLIHYNPLDSTVTAMDSAVSCMDGVTPYYEFPNPAAGNYMVKAKLFGTIPGTSGYIPTYGLSSTTWNTAATIVHATGTDNQAINMIYGTVPAGPGFIAGNVYYGAGKGTSGDAPVEGMIVYLRNTATQVLTYTYTNATGSYQFGDLAYGSYVIYPEQFDYYTTPSGVITLSPATPVIMNINFKQHTDDGTIRPMGATLVHTVQQQNTISVYPNPAQNEITLQWDGLGAGTADIMITDPVGRVVMLQQIDTRTVAGRELINISGLAPDIYLVSLRNGGVLYNQKLTIENK